MNQLSSNDEFKQLMDRIFSAIKGTEGHLTDIEVNFLALAATVPSCQGAILEIGSFKGKSTTVLALAAREAGEKHSGLWAVDPFTSPTETCPDLPESSSYPAFEENLKRAGVFHEVHICQNFSYELAKEWNEKIRFLWIDGEHTYKGAKLDFDLFRPHLQDGAIVAFHDALHSHDGPIRVFANEILLSPNFSECGFSGSIAWAKYSEEPISDLTLIQKKVSLFKKASKLVALTSFGQPVTGVNKLMYRFLRLCIPHGVLSFEQWQKYLSRK
jgi:predicted O-methyltransferase YrrM